MKKFYLGTLGCLLAMGASAQTFEPVGTLSDLDGSDEGGLLSIPSSFAVNGKSTPFAINETERGLEFNVYNKSFAVERTIKIDAPESYRRVEIEAREAIVSSTDTTADCCEYQYSEYYGGNYGYRDFYARNCCDNTVYTDEYVYEWLGYMKEHNSYDFEDINILEKREVDGGSLFVVTDDEYNLNGFYFKDNQLLWYNQYKYYEEVYTDDEYTEYYRNFYNAKNAVFTEEYIKQYINWAGNNGYAFGLELDRYYSYNVDSTSVTSTGETYFYTNLWKEINGESFPILYFVWKDESIVAHYIKYAISYTGEWVKTTEEDEYGFDTEDLIMWPVVIGQAGDLDDAYIIATQTLFNDDAKWEFIRPVYKEKVDEYNWQTEEKDRDGDGQIDYKSVYYTDQVIGYQIINEDGNVLSTIDVAENDYCDPFVIQWDDDIFFGVSISNRIDSEGGFEYYDYENYWEIYSINKNSAAIKKVAATPAMRVSPTITNRNSVVNVTLGGETAKNGGELIITDSNGRTIGRSRVEVGQTNVPVTTDRMSSGVYNITLTEKGKKVENARVIVK